MFIHLYGMNLLNLFLFFMPVAGLSFYACTIGCGLVLAAAGYQAVAQISAFTGIFDTFCCRLGMFRFFDRLWQF